MIEAQQTAPRPEFDATVEAGGYRWWYLDGISDDGTRAITVIVFIGSVFSPYYSRARARGPAPAQNHCAVNIALYRRPGKHWAMTERGAAALLQTRDEIRIGPSAMRWCDGGISLDVDEISVPWPGRIRGSVRLIPETVNPRAFALDPAGRHRWQPVFPSARIEVSMQRPGLAWQGSAYFDTNYGSVPLERDFIDWNWSRTHCADGATRIVYDRQLVSRQQHCMTLRFAPDGALEELPEMAQQRLPSTLVWRMPRATRGRLDPARAKAVETLEDTPFYARSLLRLEHEGRPATTVHESLSLQRFTRKWVQVLLPFRMPRLAGRQPGRVAPTA